jgi:hypothetical protein
MGSSKFFFNESFPTSREVWENVENFISNVGGRSNYLGREKSWFINENIRGALSSDGDGQ